MDDTGFADETDLGWWPPYDVCGSKIPLCLKCSLEMDDCWEWRQGQCEHNTG